LKKVKNSCKHIASSIVSYPSELIEKYTKKYKWHTQKIEGIPVSVALGRHKMKTEVLTGNYEI